MTGPSLDLTNSVDFTVLFMSCIETHFGIITFLVVKSQYIKAKFDLVIRGQIPERPIDFIAQKPALLSGHVGARSHLL